jgi:hypothetical protein
MFCRAGPRWLARKWRESWTSRLQPAARLPADKLNRRTDEVPVVSEDRTLELVNCPHCGQVASIEWSRTVHAVVYLKIRCIARHWFLMTAENVTYYPSQDRYVARSPQSAIDPSHR